MKYIIPKGYHYSNFIPRLVSLFNCNYLEQAGPITFTESCKYDIDEESCVNKLFGFCFGIFGVHKNSVRFGWTYNKEMNSIFIWKYVYVNSKLTKEKVYSCDINEKHTYALNVWKSINENGNEYEVYFKVDDNKIAETKIVSNKWFALTLGPYFGGHTRAPHNIIIESDEKEKG